MGKILQDDLPPLGLAGALAEVRLAVLRVPVILAILVLHPTGRRDGVLCRPGHSVGDHYPQGGGVLRLPSSLGGVGLLAAVQPSVGTGYD